MGLDWLASFLASIAAAVFVVTGLDRIRDLFRSKKNKDASDEIIVPVRYATNRESTGIDDANFYFGSNRSELSFGISHVSIPATHKIGRVERPALWKFEFSETRGRHVIVTSVVELDRHGFFEGVAKDIQLLNNKTALVFVHGFNVTFAEAAQRTAQLAYDLFLVGHERGEASLSVLPILFSWPSNGEVIRYTHDVSNADISFAHFKSFLKELSKESGAESIVLIAHSMGNRVLAAALNEIGLEMRSSDGPIIQEIILAAPDIDRELFLSIGDAVKRTGERITLYSSSRDRALQVSKALNGFPRLGDAVEGAMAIDGVDVIDASAVGADVLAHSYYGETSVLADIFTLITDGSPPAKRFGLLSHGTPPDQYWIMRRRTGG